jgi:hypothetical protein
MWVKNRKTTVDKKRVRGVGEMRLVKSGTQFYIAVNGVKFASVRTPGAAKNMFKDALKAVKGVA